MARPWTVTAGGHSGEVLCLRRPSDHRLRQILDAQKELPFPYPAVGATANRSHGEELPTGYHHDRLETDLGTDTDDRFRRAGQALLQWTPQRGAGIQIFPGEPVTADQAFVLVLRLPVTGWAVAPGRVCFLVDEPDRFGFAYGTLPGHPERGEEAFIVTRTEGRLLFQVIAFSRPHDLLARLGQPVSRSLQLRTLQAYLRAMEAASA